MITYVWWVSFVDGPSEAVSANEEDEAKILAQAKRIKSKEQWKEVTGAVRVRIDMPRRKRVNPLV
jgi:hypothetical protein